MHIALIRHGKPVAAYNPVVSASGFARWARRYERSRISQDSLPPENLKKSFDGYLIVSSSRPRSVHSAEVCLQRAPDVILADLREMEIPRYRIAARMPAYFWLGLNRGLWMLGLRGRFESFSEAKARATRVSAELHRLAQCHGRLAVFGHALMNRYVAENLLTRGWQGAPRRTAYWEIIDLDLHG